VQARFNDLQLDSTAETLVPPVRAAEFAIYMPKEPREPFDSQISL
jgi:hypothetical protein